MDERAELWALVNSPDMPVSKDPAFAEKVTDIVGLYLGPPGGAVVLSLDEKTQIQASDRIQPLLPIEFVANEKRTYGYATPGTTNLFAACRQTGSHKASVAGSIPAGAPVQPVCETFAP